jgi:hypothetical protein
MKRPKREALLLGLILLLCFAYFRPYGDANQNSRLDLVRAIVEKHTTEIDEYASNTIDYATFNGHIYSDKAPGLAFAAIPAYAATDALLRLPALQGVVRRVADRLGFDNESAGDAADAGDRVRVAAGRSVVIFFLIMLPSALLGAALHGLLGQLGLPVLVRLATPLISGLATIAFPFTLRFFAHQFVAILLFAAFYLAFLIKQRRMGERALIPIGFLLGWAVISEYPAVLIAGAVALYALIAAPSKRWALGGLVAGLPPVVMLGVYNAVTFGSPVALGYAYSVWDVQHVGFLGVSVPTLEGAWGITFSPYRGLFFLSPVLLLAIPGFVRLWKSGQTRAEALLCGWALVSFLLFNASSVAWAGGWAVGPRYVVPMLPFAAVLMGSGVALAVRRPRSVAAVAVLTAWSFVAVWAETIAGNALPDDRIINPLFDSSLPKLLAGDVARNLGMTIGLHEWASLFPLLALNVLLLVLLLRITTTGDIRKRPAIAG